MIQIIILAQVDMATGLLDAIEHVLGQRPPGLAIQAIDYHASQESLAQKLSERLQTLHPDDPVVILADVYGSSHTNAACRLLVPEKIELVSGVNVPMLLRVLSYRHLPLGALVQKALSGGMEGIVRAPPGQKK